MSQPDYCQTKWLVIAMFSVAITTQSKKPTPKPTKTLSEERRRFIDTNMIINNIVKQMYVIEVVPLLYHIKTTY